MYGTNNQIIIDALVDKIKSLKLTLSIRETEIEQLKKERDSQAQALNKPTVKE
jgi:hypothetical protein